MEDEDIDVQFEHPDFRGACWLRRRPFSDSSDEEQTGDMLRSLSIISTRKRKSSLLGAVVGQRKRKRRRVHHHGAT